MANIATRRLHDAGDIARSLAAAIAQLAPQLLPHGRRQGAEWVVGGVDGAAGTSLSVHLVGPKAGVWADFATGETGDALDLVAAVRYRGDKKAAFAWALEYLGLGGAGAPESQQAHASPRPAAAPVNVTNFRQAALRLYLEAEPRLAGTPADFYLQARGIDLSQLGRQPRALRYHPACRCTEANADLPALIAAVTNDAGEHVATHRTWLAQDRDGVWRKAPVATPKKSLGRLHGGTIRLWRGASRKPLAQAPPGELVVLGEGIETCLSVAVACPEYRVICAVSLANASGVVLPVHVRAVTWLADNDGDNVGARAGLARVINHFRAAGRDVRLARSPHGKDFNDFVMMASNA